MNIDGLRGNDALITRRTWIEEKEVPEIILKFLESGYSIAHYEAMAKLVEERLKVLLEAAGVAKYKLSRRAKDPRSLGEKLIIRNLARDKQYSSIEEIKRDIVDLAGVRIILYMPTQEDNQKVEEVIQKEWGSDVIPKMHPPQVSDKNRDTQNLGLAERAKYRPLHLGYRAMHYRVPMKKDERSKNYNWQKDDQVEVQVVSALTHAWAEVGHDIMYKSLAHGRPTLEEERILDALNGLIQSGDLLLEQFQKMYIRRTAQTFKYREDLMRFLRGFLDYEDFGRNLQPVEFPRGEGVYILFKFLQQENLATPTQLLPELENLGYPCNYREKEELIRKTFNPVPDLAPNMSLVICFIRHMLHGKEYKAPQRAHSVANMCGIMMSTLTTLDFCLGGPVEARDYLLKMSLTAHQTEGIDFLLTDFKRFQFLNGVQDEHRTRKYLQETWKWFQACASTSTSLCGFLFRLSEMGCRKDTNPITRIQQLLIQPLMQNI